MAKFRKKPVVIEAITFSELVDYAKANGGADFLFKYEGVRESSGCGAKMIDDILEIISLASKSSMRRNDFIAKKGVGDMGLLNRALEDVQFAMEELDDTTGSKSGFMFHTNPKKGEVLTITTQQFNNKVFNP